MKIAVHLDPDVMAKVAAASAAQILRDAVQRRGKAAFIAATGASQFNFLKYLVAAPGIAWERTTMFHLDEYIGLSTDHPASFRRYLRERLTSKVPIGAVHFIAGDAPDLAVELSQLNRAISSTSIDAAFVGIGENGHLAFNDPPADFETEHPYIIVTLDDACRQQQFGEGWFKTLDDVPRQAISMTVRQIMKAAHIVCTVPDKRKAQAVKACLEGEIGPMLPASILRTHPSCSLFLDKESASLLKPATLAG
jgi:glucosamine-6-phosphate deaminase